VLAFLIGASFLYRVVRWQHSAEAGLLAMSAYGALGYGILLSTEIRGYALLLGLLPLAFWLLLRYFKRPTLIRGLLLALSLDAMFYVSVTSFTAVLMLGVYTLVVYRRQSWRWWLPGLIAGMLALPEVIAKIQVAVARTAAAEVWVLPPPLEALNNLYSQFAGYPAVFLIWITLFILAAILILYRRSRLNRKTAGFFLWAVGGPIAMYILHPILLFFSARYSWWIMLGIAVWVAWGLAYLPRRLALGGVALFTALAFIPIPLADYTTYTTLTPLERNFIWLKDHMVTGDVFVADDSEQCGYPEEWDYFVRTYFPEGLQFVQNLDGYRRIWYITDNGQADPRLAGAVAKGRIAERFVGPSNCFFRLYEAPPDSEGIPFENGMRFHGMDIMEGERPWSVPFARREGETIHIRLWWSVDQPPTLDYSVGTYVLNRDTLLAEANNAAQLIYPEGAPIETSRWQPGTYYVEERDLVLPYPTPSGDMRMALAVYFWQDNKRVAAPGLDENDLLTIGSVTIKAY
jgi:hypothetical protein